MTGDLAITLGEIVQEDGLRDEVQDERVVEAIGNPAPEGMHLEENTLLTELVELWVTVEQACADELIENTEDEGRQNRKEDVIERQRP